MMNCTPKVRQCDILSNKGVQYLYAKGDTEQRTHR